MDLVIWKMVLFRQYNEGLCTLSDMGGPCHLENGPSVVVKALCSQVGARQTADSKATEQ